MTYGPIENPWTVDDYGREFEASEEHSERVLEEWESYYTVDEPEEDPDENRQS